MPWKRLTWPLCFVLASLTLQGQPFSLRWKREAWIGGTGLAMLAADLGLSAKMAPLDPQAIALLHPGDIWQPDRSAVYRFSPSAGQRSYAALASAGALAAAAGLLTPAGDWGTIGVMWLETNLLTLEGTNIAKNATARARPFAYNPTAPEDLKMEKDARRAFFSGHTSLAAANTFFAAQVFSAYFPESRFKPFVWGLAIAIPAWAGVERYLAGKHFPTDILAGYAYGALCGWLTPRLHQTGGILSAGPLRSGIGVSLEIQLR